MLLGKKNNVKNIQKLIKKQIDCAFFAKTLQDRKV
jgi:hypothetical protein